MASLTLKNLPDDLLNALRDAAKNERRSLTQEVIHLLSSALRGRAESLHPDPEVLAQVAAWRKLAGRWKSDVARATEAAELAERRTSGREVDF